MQLPNFRCTVPICETDYANVRSKGRGEGEVIIEKGLLCVNAQNVDTCIISVSLCSGHLLSCAHLLKQMLYVLYMRARGGQKNAVCDYITSFFCASVAVGVHVLCPVCSAQPPLSHVHLISS